MNTPSTPWPSPLVSLAPPGLAAVNVGAKLELYGPTGSHKDRECALIVPAAMQQGFSSVGCSSTGNLAQALAAACQTAGLDCELWLSTSAGEATVRELEEMGARVHLVDGTYPDAVRAGNVAMAERKVFNANPSQCLEKIAASHALGTEILDVARATHIVCATNNGSLAAGLLRAVREAGRAVKLVAVTCRTSQRAASIAGAFELEDSWRQERDAADCEVIDVGDSELEHWEAWLASQKFPVQPAAAATLAALPKLGLAAGDHVVCVLSGLRAGAGAPLLT